MPFCCKVSEMLFYFIFLPGFTSAQAKKKTTNFCFLCELFQTIFFLTQTSSYSTTRRAERAWLCVILALKAHCKQGKAGSGVRHRVS